MTALLLARLGELGLSLPVLSHLGVRRGRNDKMILPLCLGDEILNPEDEILYPEDSSNLGVEILGFAPCQIQEPWQGWKKFSQRVSRNVCRFCNLLR